MLNVAKVRFGPSLSEIRAQVSSKKPLLRYLVDGREELKKIPPHEFLNTSFAYLHSPFSLPDIRESIEIILEYSKNKKHIVLYGDRDADGVSSTSSLAFFFKSHPYFKEVPISVMNSSESDPYGLCAEALEKINKVAPDLLITLDFGSSQADEIDQLTKKGTRVIVLDHHEIPERIPEKTFLVNPRRLDSRYPEKKICTAVLAFKIIQAILFRLSDEFDKIYFKEENGETFYFQNGIRVSEHTSPSLSQIPSLPKENLFPFPERHSTKGELPDDDERFLFYTQCLKIRDFFESLEEEVDLAGIGTITDLMPLGGENRMIVKLSLQSLLTFLDPKLPKRRYGIRSLLGQLSLNPKNITAKDLGWSIGPLLNSAGRMGKTEEAVNLLLSEDLPSADKKAKILSGINEERKDRTKRNLDRADRYFKRKTERTEHPIVFCYEPDMEPGVSGIVATRMVEDFKRPAVFIAPDNGDARGSIRSYSKENVIELLNLVSEHLIHFGGHPEAGGFSVELDKIPDLEKAMYEKSKLWLVEEKEAIDKYILATDITVIPEELNDKLYKEWKPLEPFGQGNPDVKIAIKGIKPIHLTPLSGGKHIRFNILGSGSMKFILWNKGDEFQKAVSHTDKLDLIGKLEENYFMGRSSIQFVVDWFGEATAVE
ncbi:single-stranded-DNA-specific exonuclease RecJ [Leptospira ilyithenensis]|uniref:Single-stranded-DNA-specific exonuclease RecJ n=1 Tax=Leptospira ilyithenensis TaxID=2484901 RepID=A0A4R9LT22_9LEPT|nr:single-stranded-DNA-specific exonuclease RecJ [Leptospira ilyithenensis]TGN11886.1 single-stranded-DNA-specific exonuclease RecJ [Leptospira ilyithenensis]